MPDPLASLTTESSNPASIAMDALSALEIVKLMNQEDGKVAEAVGREAAAIARAVDVVVERMRRGGRLIYLGAGTSGRLGVLDAAECPPTFNTRPEQVVGIIAGGTEALTRAVEGAEDREELALADLEQHQVGASDCVLGIASSGRTPYVLAGLRAARARGAATLGLACNAESALAELVDVMIAPIVGPEVLSGSTRLKAGTATKLVLNTLTTATMVRLGKTYGNRMVDLRATNEKLKQRARRIVCELAGVEPEQAETWLARSEGEVKTALVMQRWNVSLEVARAHLAAAAGRLRLALETQPNGR